MVEPDNARLGVPSGCSGVEANRIITATGWMSEIDESGTKCRIPHHAVVQNSSGKIALLIPTRIAKEGDWPPLERPKSIAFYKRDE